jgi:pSer/pThr/pTyr-binding forkhead associated (FHA) protein
VVRQGSPGLDPGSVLWLDSEETTFGRALENDVIVSDARASRLHARIVSRDGIYLIEDLGSRNGTVVKGRRISALQALESGDVIAIGGTVFAFQLADSAETLIDNPEPGDLVVDESTATVLARGRPVKVTAKEFRAVSFLYAKAGAICTKDELARHVWPEYEGGVGDYNIEQLISRLRRKLDEEGAGKYLLTVRGLGYRLTTG